MKRNVLLSAVVACAVLLCSCGEDKKISMDGEPITTVPSQIAEPTTPVRIEYVEKFGEKLAAFHGLNYTDTLTAKDKEGKDITINIDVSTSVANEYANTVYHYDMLMFDENERNEMLHTFLGDGPIYCGDLGCYPKTELQRLIDENTGFINENLDKIKNLSASDELQKAALEDDIHYLQKTNENYKELMKTAPEDWEPVADYTHGSYWSYTPDGKDKISMDFGSSTLNPSETPMVSLIKYPVYDSDSRIKLADALKIINSLTDKFGVLPVNSDDKTLEFDLLDTKDEKGETVYFTFVLGKPDIPGFSDEDFYYYCTFFDETITLGIKNPIKSISEVKDAPLLSFAEIKSIIRKDLAGELVNYYQGSKSTTFNVSSIVLDLTNDPASKSLIPTWRVYVNEGGPVKLDTEILRINAIDGSLLKVSFRFPYSPM